MKDIDLKHGSFEVLLIARHPYGGFPPLGDWQMARALGRTHRVLYVEPPEVVRRPRPAAYRRRSKPTVHEAADNILVTRPLVLPGASRRGLARIADVVLVPQIRAAAAMALSSQPVVVSFDPLRGHMPQLDRSLMVFWRRDRLGARNSRTARLLAHRERALLNAADLVSCVSADLAAEAAQITDTPVVHIPNGCDAEHFGRPRPRPSGFPATGPVIGFVGGSFWRLDRPLIAAIADARPDWTILMIGDDASPLPQRNNISRVGYVPYTDIPAWMQHLDVGIVPYDTSAFNRGSFPLKALEYLAAGIPVVSTPVPAFDGFEPAIRQALSGPGIIEAVESALTHGPDAAACRSLASQHTWRHRAEELIRAIAASHPDSSLRPGRQPRA